MAHYREEDDVIQSVWEHSFSTAELAKIHASKIGMGSWGELAGLLHDLGKQTDLFDQYIRQNIGLISEKEIKKKIHGKVDHSSIGAQYIYGLQSLGNREKAILALLIRSHHEGLIDCIGFDGTNLLEQKMQKEETKERVLEAIQHLEEAFLNKVQELTNDTNKFKIVDPYKREGTQEQIYKHQIKILFYRRGLFIKYLFSCLIDADRQDTADFQLPNNKQLRLNNKYIPWDKLIERLEKHMMSFKIRNHIDEIRATISKRCKEVAESQNGIFQLTVPTGGGKTLSSLRFALHHAKQNNKERIIYIVPFNTIIDQNAQEIRSILEKEDVGTIVLEQHSNLTPDEETDQTKVLAQNWDAPIVLTSMVQFLDTFFASGTRSIRRMHQLANSIIIFDEIQTLGVRFIHLFNQTIRFLNEVCNTSIVLCTATQPLLDRVEPRVYALPIMNENKIMKEVDVLHKNLSRTKTQPLIREGGWEDDEIATFILEKVQQQKSVLCIVNTKQMAMKIAKCLKGKYSEVYHLSTAMCGEHRMHCLDKMLQKLDRKKREAPIICISTQLIEAGVNIDFDVVVRSIAGLDSIVQAAGRCNRNGLMKEKGEVYIVNPQNENLSRLKDISQGTQNTLRILEEYKKNPNDFDDDLLSPKALEQYYKYYFFKRKEEMFYPIKRIEGGYLEDNLFELLASNEKARIATKSQKPSQIEPLPFAFKTAAAHYYAIDPNTQGIIVPYGEKGKELINNLCSLYTLEEGCQYMKLAQRYSINVFAHQIQELSSKKAIHGIKTQKGENLRIYYLDERHYDEVYGLVMEANTLDAIIL
jgi:CRISPR-associated endonuclease/helicase Cas3